MRAFLTARTLAPLRDPVITDPGDDAVARCGTGPDRSAVTTTCSSPHTYRTADVSWLSGQVLDGAPVAHGLPDRGVRVAHR